jgi:hypothetical protein
MRSLLILLILEVLLLVSTSILAQPPVVTHNVVVLQQVNASQCPASFRGRVAPVEQQRAFLGEYSMGGPGILACTGCAMRYPSHNCVCRTCYDYSNGF